MGQAFQLCDRLVLKWINTWNKEETAYIVSTLKVRNPLASASANLVIFYNSSVTFSQSDTEFLCLLSHCCPDIVYLWSCLCRLTLQRWDAGVLPCVLL